MRVEGRDRSVAESKREPGSLLVLGVFVVLVAVLERCLSLLDGPRTYVLCVDLVESSEELDREASVNQWLLLVGLVLSAAALVVSRVRRWRVLAALTLPVVLILVVLADGHAARADAVASEIWTSQTCDEPTYPYDTSRGWFDWSPLGQ
ncbi:hypothetical protein ACFW2Y_14060 [Streptomyces sp. NPDC058877]|uniref:hypothetical protein n=1 Tax=unclassified Streptomyces TaxID=2593676 RepID=UPI0036B2B18C